MKKKLPWKWIGTRWLEFRYGHTVYLVFAMSFTQFILIFVNLGLEKIGVTMSIVTFTGIFLAAYIPVATFVGYLHRERQLEIDMIRQWEQNPQFMKLMRDIEELKGQVAEIKNSLVEMAAGRPKRQPSHKS